MPIKYVIDDSQRLVYATAVGSVTMPDLVDHLRALSADPRYIPPMKKLVDYRAGHVIAMTTAETRRLTEFKLELGDKFRGEKCAFLVSDDLDFGLSRVSGAYADPVFESGVFREAHSALAWLNVGPDILDTSLGNEQA